MPEKEKKTIVITGTIVARVFCTIGLLSCAALVIIGWVKDTEINWPLIIGAGVACGVGLLLSIKRR